MYEFIDACRRMGEPMRKMVEALAKVSFPKFKPAEDFLMVV